MNLFDIRTILFSHVITNAICLLAMVSLWLRNRERFAGLDFWVAAFGMEFLALLLIFLRGIVPDFLSIIIGNALIIAGMILLYMGLQRFVEKKTAQVHNYLLLAVFIVIHFYFAFVHPSLLIRTMNLMAGAILLCSQCAWLLICRAESDLRPISRAVGYIFLVICLLALTRVFVDLVVNPGNDFLASGMFEALAVLTSQMLIIFLTFGLVLVVNWRLILDLERDIVKHKQVEQELRKLTDVKNRERLARDLHDSVNQSVHSLVLFSETLISTLEKENMARARQIAGRLQESARQALKETRLLLYEIQVPASARNVDLIPDVEARLATVERRAGVKAQIIQEGPLDHCPRVWYEDLFGITIEALNNALKHAQARNMQIRIRCSPRHIELEVIDDGIGFDPGKPHAGGLGLQNMRDRASLIGGELTILSTPQQGSCVRFRAELKE